MTVEVRENTADDRIAAIEVLIAPNGKRLELQAYTQILNELRLSLSEVDRLALPGRSPRLKWGVADLRMDDRVIATLAPLRIPSRRPTNSLALPGHGLVDGIKVLQEEPEIPALFSEQTVTRVQNLGRALADGRVEEVQVRSLNGTRHEGIVDEQTVENARRAVTGASRASSSVVGTLDVLHGRNRSHPRAQVFDPITRRAVTVKAREDQLGDLHDAYMQRVMVVGELTRNSAGQAVRIDMVELHVLPQSERTLTAWEVLGVDRDFTGGLSTDEFLNRSRRG